MEERLVTCRKYALNLNRAHEELVNKDLLNYLIVQVKKRRERRDETGGLRICLCQSCLEIS